MTGEGCDSSNSDSLSRLRWRCRRGLLELDIWLAGFAETGLPKLTVAESVLMETMLQESDMDLLDWLEARQDPPLNYASLIARMRASV